MVKPPLLTYLSCLLWPLACANAVVPQAEAKAERRNDAAAPDAAVVVGADPSLNAKFTDPELNVAEWVKGFEGESREVFVHRARIVEVVQARKGHVVADVGAGTGLFTFLLAEVVGPSGKVWAVDVSPRFLQHIEAQARRRKLPQVVTVKGTATSPGLPARSVDRVLIVDTYHHFERPIEMLSSLARVLKPDGRLVVVDFEREPESSAWTQQHVRAGRAEVIREFEAAGYELERREDFLSDNYVLVFKPPLSVPGRSR